MEPKEYEVIYKFTVAPTVIFPSAFNLDTESIGELIWCKDCKYYENVLFAGTQFEYGECLLTSKLNGSTDYCSWAKLKVKE